MTCNSPATTGNSITLHTLLPQLEINSEKDDQISNLESQTRSVIFNDFWQKMLITDLSLPKLKHEAPKLSRKFSISHVCTATEKSHKWENTDPLAVCFACKYLSKNYTKQKSKEEKYIYIYNKSVSQVLTFRFEPSLQIAIFRDQFELSCQGTLSLS